MARHMEQPALRHSKPCLGEDAVEAFAFGGGANALRSRHDQRLDVRRDVVPADHAGGFAQVGEPGVGAGTDERDVDAGALDRIAAVEAHEVERLGERGAGRRLDV